MLMEDAKIREVAANFLNSRDKFWKSEEIEEYFKQYSLENKQVLEILNRLADDYIFRWLDFISLKLPSLVGEEGFLDFLKKIIPKIKGDLTQGSFIKALIRIGEQEAKLGFSLHQKMLQQDDDIDLIYYSSFPLGGSGRKDFEHAFPIISKEITNKNPNIRATGIRSLRIIFESSEELKRADEIFEALDKLSQQEERVVQIEALNAYFDFSLFRYSLCVEHLKAFAKRRNSEIRFRIADLLWLRNLNNKEDEIDLLTICAEDDNPNVLSRVATALSQKGQEFPEASLRIVKSWILRDRYHNVHDIEYFMNEIGKLHLDKCVKEVETWVAEEEGKAKLQFFIPIILQELGKNNYKELVELIEGWPSKNGRFWTITILTIRRILTEIYPGRDSDVPTTELCFRILAKLVEEKNLDVNEIIKDESNRLFQCLKIIDALQQDRKEADFAKISWALEKHAAIKNFLGADWFKMEQEGKRGHALLVLLSRSVIDEANLAKDLESMNKEKDHLKREIMVLRIRNKKSPQALVDYLDGILNQVASKTKKLKDLQNGLRNPDQFWETISEIEVISAFIGTHQVEIAPRVRDKKLDLSIDLGGEKILIEVINPDMFKPLKYMTEKAFGLENRARGKIYDEFKEHMKDLEAYLEDKCVIVVIDIGRSEIDYDFVEDYLLGTWQFTWQIEKATGKVVNEYPSRSGDSMHALEEKTDVLSAVVCYKATIKGDLKFHREGKIMLNPHAKKPLSPNSIKLIQESLFV
jgi:hypothetical protein